MSILKGESKGHTRFPVSFCTPQLQPNDVMSVVYCTNCHGKGNRPLLVRGQMPLINRREQSRRARSRRPLRRPASSSITHHQWGGGGAKGISMVQLVRQGHRLSLPPLHTHPSIWSCKTWLGLCSLHFGSCFTFLWPLWFCWCPARKELSPYSMHMQEGIHCSCSTRLPLV